MEKQLQKNLTDFILAASTDNNLGREFSEQLQKGNADLPAWFQSKGFSLNEEDRKKLADNANFVSKVLPPVAMW